VSARLSGALGTRPTLLGRLIYRAGSRELAAFVVPGQEISRARGLDLQATGLNIASTPRHASVLVVVGGLPEGLKKAATVAYTQMPRPRAVLAVGTEDVSPLPRPDVSASSDEDSLAYGVTELRRLFAERAFDPEARDFEAAALRSRTEYACPMHPEVVQDEPGACPRCGMDLVPRETGDEERAGHEGHDHTRHEGMDHGEGSGEEDEGHGHGGDHAHHGAADEDGETMEPGGEDHGAHEGMDRGGHDHGDHGGTGFMSMVEMTQGTPRSSDGLQMEWVEAPFGPLFPGLPGGLALTFTLDGDTVAEAETGSVVGGRADDPGVPVGVFVERLAGLDPLSPASYRLLALRAVEHAAGTEADDVALARVGALERERAASHLSWLAGFGHLIGYPWLAGRAEELQLALLRADAGGVAVIQAEVRKLARRVERTPLLRRKLAGVGELPEPAGATGPVARAGGVDADARAGEEAYRSLGFEPLVMEGSDALARLRVRLAEVGRSLDLAQKAGEASVSSTVPEAAISGRGAATVETPRGAARLGVTLEGGEVTAAKLETPSARHIGLVGAVTEGREVADALVGVASLDLSPWGVAG
jgi:Ni,Fe-hydrogenase III large subunit